MALTPKYLQQCTDDIEKIYWELGTDILVDIAERIRAVNGMTATAEYLNEKLREMGLQQAWINQMLARIMNTTEQEVEKLMNESTHKSTRSTFDILEKAGYDTTGLEFSDQILKTTNALNGDLQNLTRTTGQLATKAMMNAYDQAYLQVASGAYSLDQATTNVIQKLAKDGLGQVEYPSGAHRTVEAAVRVAVRTAVSQNALACEKQVIDELDVNLVETSAHIGARPSHEVWQGRVFWVKHPEGNYANFYEATGYGTPTGLGGYNCRHQFYPYFPELGQTYHPIPHEVNDAAYKAEQQQRAYERKLREWDRKEKILKAGGQDTTEARRWKNYYKGQIQKLVDQSKGFLKRDYSAEKAWSKKIVNAGNGSTGMTMNREEERSSFHRKAVARADVYNTTAYREKVASFHADKEIGNMLATEAQNMLKRRNGSLHEDLVYLDPITKKVLRVLNYPVEQMVIPNEKMKRLVLENPGKIIALHNHPESQVPSFSDFTSGDLLAFGLVACHNGSIFKYTVLEKVTPDKEEFINYQLDKLQSAIYNDSEKELANAIGNLLNCGISIEVKL